MFTYASMMGESAVLASRLAAWLLTTVNRLTEEDKVGGVRSACGLELNIDGRDVAG